MNTQNPENYDDIDEARVLVKTVLADFPQTTDFVRQLSGVNDACSVTDIVPLEGGDTAFAFSYGFADYALRIGNDPDTGERVLHDIVAMPLYDKAGAGFYAQLVCWLGHDFDGGQQYCRRISDSVALVTLPVQTEYEYEEGDDGITNISSALAPGIGHYAACLKENSVTAVEAIPAGIAANAYVLPVAPAEEKNGTFVNWEGRVRPFGQAHVSRSRTDRQVLGMLADEMGVDLQVDDLVVLHEQLADLGLWRGQRPSVAFGPAPQIGTEALASADGVEARLTTHKPMLDAGRLQDGEPFLAATALRPIARVGTDLAQRLSLASGQEVTVATATGSITLPAVVGGVSDGTVWLPECSAGSTVHQTLGAGHGSQVTLTHAAEVLR